MPAPGERENISEDVVAAVAEAKGTSPLDLRPLATVIDPDALNALVTSVTCQPDDATVVSFAYSGYDVTVTAEGWVDVSERDD